MSADALRGLRPTAIASTTQLSPQPPWASVPIFGSHFPCACDDAADVGIEAHCHEQKDSEEHAKQRTLNACEEEPLLDHPEYDRAERGADHGAVPAGQQGSADDNRDDRLELLEQPIISS
jgi:hypothetical protein